MFGKDFLDIIPELEKGRIFGKFKTVKKSTKYGIKLVSKSPLDALAAQAD